MMTFNEIKRWAKEKGYSVLKEKDDTINGASYYWAKNGDKNKCGVALSVSKLATAIYNDMTDNKWVEYQKEYQEKKEIKRITPNDY